MKLSVLFLLTLLALSSAVSQDFDETKVSSLSLDLERSPEIAVEALMTDVPLPSLSRTRQKRQVRSSSIVSDDGTILEWVTWNNSLPNDTVSINNQYVGRIDYVCKYNCEAGFYSPSLGPYCHYLLNHVGHYGSPFEVLVNKDNFEILEWKGGSSGSVPKNSVRTCPGQEVYVGMNDYGLGMVVTQDKVFYLPWKGSEYTYGSYQVLTINENIVSQQIDNVVYNTDQSTIVHYPPEIIRDIAISNYECSPAMKTDSLSKMYQVKHMWDNTYSVKFGARTTIKTGIPFTTDGGVEISTDLPLQFNSEGSVVDSITDTVSVQVNTPPNHTCTATIMRHRYQLNIPYTARLRRTYGNGKVHMVFITGTYDSIRIGEVRAVVNRCEPVANVKPCPLKTDRATNN